MKNYKFWINLFLPLVLGTIVGILINGSIDYNIVNKPPLSPSGTLFPIVWSILYFLIGLGYALYKENYSDDDISLVYYLQLGFNLLWSIIFFSLKLRFISIIWIIILDILVIILFIKYLKTNKISAYLLIPYILWILFATYLNIGVYLLN